MRNIKFLIIILILPFGVLCQPAPTLTLDEILQRIDTNNLLLQSYGLRSESYLHKGEAATAWMPPMVGVGTYMTPYPFQKSLDPGNKGSLMIRAEQEIPNFEKLRARKDYIRSKGEIEKATRSVTGNDLRAQAKRLYFGWVIAAQRIKVLQEDERILSTLKKIEELRYSYNQSKLGNIYKMEGRIQENKNQILMQEGEIAKARAWMNSLMNQPGSTIFLIDTSGAPVFTPMYFDTATLAASRGDVLRMNASIQSMNLNIRSMSLEKKPSFTLQFDHMSSFNKVMPRSFSVMAMMSIPFASWSSRMYKSEEKSMEYEIQAIEKEKAAILLQTQGMLYGIQAEIQAAQKRIQGLEKTVIPSMQKSFDANFLNYQENKLEMPVVIDSWEALNMLQNDLLDEKLRLYQMIVEYEKELYR